MRPIFGSQCWDEGYHAYYRGCRYDENPYSRFGIYDQRYVDWVDGMDTAYHDECFVMTPLEYFY